MSIYGRQGGRLMSESYGIVYVLNFFKAKEHWVRI